jgi:hypothetical protein
MTYASIRNARLLAKLKRIQDALEALYSQYESLAATENESYEFDSGDGKQKTKRRSLTDILDNIQRLEAEEASVINDLYNMGLVSVKVRRKP